MTGAAAWVQATTGAPVQGAPELVQELWSGYGRLERWRLAGPGASSVILKTVDVPAEGRGAHPRGWAGERSSARKLESYRIERRFYRDLTGAAGAPRVPAFLGARETEGGGELLLEDLDGAGFGGRREVASSDDVHACLRWLAAFHGTFLGARPEGLWERGTYWHLGTRPDEFAAIEDPDLRSGGERWDRALSAARHRTLVHGDAKLANFCFPDHGSGSDVAAVDFQYVGGGVGVQDLAYFLGSCLDDDALERDAAVWLERYFEALGTHLPPGVDRGQLVEEWRALWPVAWADFHRFLAGWAPGHWKLGAFSRAMVQAAR